MTYQPPPPGAGGAPAKFDPKSVNKLDWGIIGAGVLAFIFSFISFYTPDVDTNGSCPPAIADAADQGGSASAWHEVIGGGFFAWFAMLFAIAGAALVAISIFAPQTKLPVAARLGGLGLFAAATLFELISIFVIPGDSATLPVGSGCSVEVGVGHGFGFWASLIVILAGLGLSLVRFQSTGGQLPGGLQGKVPNVGGYDKDRGIGGGQNPPPPPAGGPPPPPPGYGPPQ